MAHFANHHPAQKQKSLASGNTMAKLANDIIDGTATMAVKSHLRRERPVVIGISTNNGLSGAGENIGKLLNRKHFYFVVILPYNRIVIFSCICNVVFNTF